VKQGSATSAQGIAAEATNPQEVSHPEYVGHSGPAATRIVNDQHRLLSDCGASKVVAP
jgi:hypothetical protein